VGVGIQQLGSTMNFTRKTTKSTENSHYQKQKVGYGLMEKKFRV